MPFPMEHAARINDPGKYKEFRREKNKMGPGIDVIWGVPMKGPVEIQAIRFNKDKYTPEETKAWLKEHDYHPIEFSVASADAEESPIEVVEMDRKVCLDARADITLHKTPEGYLRGAARATRSGIFEYVSGGEVIKVLRHPDEVMKKESLDSLAMIPITNLHPVKEDPETLLLDADKARRFTVGFTGQDVKPDGEYVTVPVCVYDAGAIETIKEGRQELSCGYEANYILKPGVYNGETYDAYQTDIKYNHLALEDKGRAGPGVRIDLMDSKDSQLNFNSKESESMLVKFTLDGIEYETAPEIKKALEKALADNGTLTAKVSTVQATLDAASAELTQLKAVDVSALVNKAVEERITLISSVKGFVDCTDAEIQTLPVKTIKEKAIMKKFPAISLDGKDESYVNAMFDAVLLAKKEDTESVNEQKKVVLDAKDKQGNVVSAEKSYAAYRERLKTAHLK